MVSLYIADSVFQALQGDNIPFACNIKHLMKVDNNNTQG